MNSKGTFFLFIAGGICLAGIYIFKAQTLTRDNVFVVGTAAGYAPFVSVNPQGDYEGFDIDIANALAQKMGKKLIIKDLGSMAPLFMALDDGSIDAIIWGLSITHDRLKTIAMICYQGELTTSYPLLFWQKIPATIKRIDDMKGKIVCVESGSSQDAVLSKYPFIEKKYTERVDDSLLNIQYGKADAALVEPAIAKKFNQKFPELQILGVPLAVEDQVQGVGIAVKKTNGKLIDEIAVAVNGLKKSGIIATFEKKWNIV